MVKNEVKLQESKLKKLLGFDINESKSWNRFGKLMNRPEDPGNLAIFRILFGIYCTYLKNYNNLRSLKRSSYGY
jgi:hypothetical protein